MLGHAPQDSSRSNVSMAFTQAVTSRNIDQLAAALAARGYNDPTPVQKAIMGEDISGRDILVSAETGSGKTIAFGLAISPDILRDKDKLSGKPKVLIVTPTRELTLQVKQELEWLACIV